MKVVICVLGVLVTAQLCLAAIIHVPADQPTIQAGINAAVDGDTVLVAPGTYFVNLSIQSKGIALISSDGRTNTTLKPILPATHLVAYTFCSSKVNFFEGFTLANVFNASSLYAESCFVYIAGNRFTGGQQTGDGDGTADLLWGNFIVKDNVFDSNQVGDQGGGIMLISQDSSLVEGNSFVANSANHGGGISVWGSHAVIRRNLFRLNTANGYGGAIFLESTSGCLAYNNTIDSCKSFSNLGGGVAYFLSANDTVFNNIMTCCTGYSIWQGSSSGFLAAYNNCFSGTPADYSGIIAGTGSISADPQFVGGTPFDYHLLLTSPCIDAGNPDPAYNDPNGTRNDMGAHPAILGIYPIPYLMNFGPLSSWPYVFSLVPTVYWHYCDTSATTQAGYEVEVGTDTNWTVAEMWSSGAIMLSDTNVTYSGLPLSDYSTYYLRLRVNNGIAWGGWSQELFYTHERTIHVPSDRNTIQGGINLAIDGDTVLVAPGTYAEHINFNGKKIVVTSAKGADTTFITKIVPGLDLVRFENGEDTNAVLKSFTLFGVENASAIDCRYSSPRIEDNIFTNNTDGNEGVVKASHAGPLLRGNVFCRNLLYGFALMCLADSSHIIGNTFVQNYRGLLLSGSHAVITNNIVVRSIAEGVLRESGGLPLLDYNDVWGNGTSYYGIVPGPNSISVDPLFCDTATNDFHLASTSPCVGTGQGGANIGALGIGCPLPAAEQPQITNINIGDYEDSLHLTNHTPPFSWKYFDPQSRPLTKSELEVGTDNDWSVAEMWQPPTINSPDTSITYAGLPLLDGSIYYVRIRVHNDTIWGNWKSAAFRLNSPPTAPVPNLPANASFVNTGRPTLRVTNASDPENDVLRYDFQVYSDSTLTVLVTYASGINQGGGQTAWKTDSLRNENARHWWRARASDGYETGEWSGAWSFVVNAYNEPPGSFALISPADGSIAANRTPTLIWNYSQDPDPGAVVSYSVYLALDSLFTFVNEVSGIDSTRWTVTDPLSNGTRYWWKVKAVDQSLSYAWSQSVFRFRTPTLGDADGNGLVNVSDVVYLVNYIFAGGSAPVPLMAGDADCNGFVNISDAVYLVVYIFSGGPAPCE